MIWRYVFIVENFIDFVSRGGYVEKVDLWWYGLKWFGFLEYWLADVLNESLEES